MAVNKYFQVANLTNTNEQDLVRKLAAETIQLHGIDVLYIPRTINKSDTLFGEDILSSFDEKFEIEMYIDSTDQFDGDGDLLSKFGLTVKDEIRMTVSTLRFPEVTGMTKPLEGDLIYFPLSKGIFEIKFVEDEQPFYPINALPVFEIRCELFDYSNEDFATGDDIVDDLAINLDDLAPFNTNDDLETEGDGFQDFSESSPFGTY